MKTREFDDLFFVLQDVLDSNKGLMTDVIHTIDVDQFMSNAPDFDPQFVVNY
jgi:hypothetical protein